MSLSFHESANALMNSQQPWLPARDQATQHLSMDDREAHEVPLLAEELLAINSCWRKGSHFSSEVLQLVGCSCSWGWTHILVQADSSMESLGQEGKKNEMLSWTMGNYLCTVFILKCILMHGIGFLSLLTHFARYKKNLVLTRNQWHQPTVLMSTSQW